MTEYQRRGLKTTDAQIQEILRLYHDEGWSQGRLARHFGIAAVTVGRYVRGESRREASGDPVADHMPAGEVIIPPEKLNESVSLLSKLIQAPQEEDPIDAILRRRSEGASAEALAARLKHRAEHEEKGDEQAQQTDGGSSSDAAQGGGVRAPDGG